MTLTEKKSVFFNACGVNKNTFTFSLCAFFISGCCGVTFYFANLIHLEKSFFIDLIFLTLVCSAIIGAISFVCFIISFAILCRNIHKHYLLFKEIHIENIETGENSAMKYLFTPFSQPKKINDISHAEFRKVILENDINHQDLKGNTLLHLVLEHFPESCFIEMLIFMGANPYLANKSNIIPLSLLSEQQKEYVVSIERYSLKKDIKLTNHSTVNKKRL